MNIIPPTGYGLPVISPKTRTRRLDALDNHKRELPHGDRRRRGERRQEGKFFHKNEIEMRQIGDRRRSNRLFVTT